MIKKNMLEILKEAAKAEHLTVCNESDEYSEYDSDEEYYDDEDMSDEEYDECCDDEDMSDEEYDEDDDISDEELDKVKQDIIDSYDDMEEVEDDDLEYTAEMVAVIESSAGGYLVEYDNLAKLMESAKCDGYTAMQKISECNNIPLDEMKLVVESEDRIKSVLQEKAVSRKAKKKKSLAMKSSARFLNDIKNKGITIVKKKKKAKRKKKK